MPQAWDKLGLNPSHMVSVDLEGTLDYINRTGGPLTDDEGDIIPLVMAGSPPLVHEFCARAFQVGLKAFQLHSSGIALNPARESGIEELPPYDACCDECEEDIIWLLFSEMQGYKTDIFKKTSDPSQVIDWVYGKLVDFAIESCTSGDSEWV